MPKLVRKVNETEPLELVQPSEDDLIEEGLREEFCPDGVLDVGEHIHRVLASVPGKVGANDP
jgi:hypothetical protein